MRTAIYRRATPARPGRLRGAPVRRGVRGLGYVLPNGTVYDFNTSYLNPITPAQSLVSVTGEPPLGTIMPNGQPYVGGPVSAYQPGVIVPNENPELSTTVPIPGQVPTGTYTQSCQQIAMQGDTLTAQCETVAGTWVPATLPNASQYVPGSIYNDNGVLGGQLMTPAQVLSAPPPVGQIVTTIPPNGPLPPGQGYQQVEAPGSQYPYVFIGPQAGQTVYPYGASYPYYGYGTPTYNLPLPDGSLVNPQPSPASVTGALPGSSSITSSLSSFFTQSLGPLPMWAWLGIGAGAWLFLRNKGGRR